jgi:hypothetical protein
MTGDAIRLAVLLLITVGLCAMASWCPIHHTWNWRCDHGPR